MKHTYASNPLKTLNLEGQRLAFAHMHHGIGCLGCQRYHKVPLVGQQGTHGLPHPSAFRASEAKPRGWQAKTMTSAPLRQSPVSSGVSAKSPPETRQFELNALTIWFHYVSLFCIVLPFALLRISLNVFYMGLRFKSVYAVSFDVSVLIPFQTAHGLAAGRLRRAELSTNALQKRVQSLRRCRPPADSIEWALRETCFMYRF